MVVELVDADEDDDDGQDGGGFIGNGVWLNHFQKLLFFKKNKKVLTSIQLNCFSQKILYLAYLYSYCLVSYYLAPAVGVKKSLTRPVFY